MTYLEKLREITGREIRLDQNKDTMYIDNVYQQSNCPTSWFKMKDNGIKFCIPRRFCNQTYGFIKCWDREYQGEEYIGRFPIKENKEFTSDEIGRASCRERV